MFNSYYEINVSLNGRHYFATHPRSIQSERDLLKVYADFEKKFPKKDGYELGITYHPSTAYGVKVNTNANQVINSIDDAVKDAKKLPPYDAAAVYPTLFDHWLNGRIGHFGSFQTNIFEAFIHADLCNRAKLASIYPEWFGEKCESVR